MSLFRSSTSVAGMLARSGAATCRNFLPAAYHSSTVAAASQSDDPLGTSQREGRVEGAFDQQRSEGDTYYATDKYPGTESDKAGGDDAAAAASKGHPQGPADTSSMNDPAGQGREPAGNDHVHHPGRPDAAPGGSKDTFKPSGPNGSRNFSSSSSSGAMRTFQTLTRRFKLNIFPDSADSSSSSSLSCGDAMACGNGVVASVRRYASQGGKEGLSQGSTAGDSASTEKGQPDSSEIPLPSHSWTSEPPSKKEPERADVTQEAVEGGTGSPISGSWRAVTADFAAGGDDMTGGGSAGTVADDMGMKVGADTGLPQLKDVNDGGAHSAGFGAQRDPTESGDQEYTARQTEKSTGQDPGNAGSG